MKIRKFFNFFIIDNLQWKIIERLGIIFGILAFFGAGFTIFKIIPDINQTKNDIQIIQEKLNSNEAEGILNSYFYNIEQGNFENAFNLFTDKKKKNDSLEEFTNWLNNFVSFEGLKIIELKEKQSISKKVFLAEFGFKRRGMKSIQTKWGFYLTYDGKDWKIDYSNVLYENWYKEGVCDFYKFEDYCK